MEGEKIFISERQLQRLEVKGLVEAGKITLKAGAEKIGVSYRQTKRIRKRVQEKGGKGLIHGNTAKPANHRMKEGIKAKVLQLSQKVHGEFNGFIKFPLNLFMTNHLDNKSKRRLREWTHERFVGAAAFPLSYKVQERLLEYRIKFRPTKPASPHL